MISKKFICDFVEKHKVEFANINPSFFEWTVGLAFEYFKKQKVDVAVIEVGLGGRLDSTNIISPELSVITNIGRDHMNLLGNSLQKIAAEKAGIIKRNIPVVIGQKSNATEKIFRATAIKNNSPIRFASSHYKVVLKKELSAKTVIIQMDVFRNGKLIFKNLKLDLPGHYQLKNVCTVLQAIELLQKSFPVTDRQISTALKNVRRLTGLRGRWEMLSGIPLIICDTGHNEDGIREVLTQLKKMKYRKLHFVLGVVSDKDISKMLKLLPKNAEYYFCKADIPRGMNAEELQKTAMKSRLMGKQYPSVRAAFGAAKANAGSKDLIFIGGSTFTVAEVI